MFQTSPIDFAPVAFTLREGGDWYPWPFLLHIQEVRKVRTIGAVMFADGAVLDFVLGGWRSEREGQVIRILYAAGAAYYRDFEQCNES